MMNLRENLPSFIVSSLIAFLADYLGLGRVVQRALSSVIVRHLLPSPPPAHTISYHESLANAGGYWGDKAEEEPFVYAESRYHTNWLPPPSPTYEFNGHLILLLEIVVVFCIIRTIWYCLLLQLKQRRVVFPRRALLDLAFSEEIEECSPPPPAWLFWNSLLNAISSSFLRFWCSMVNCISRMDGFYPYFTGLSRRPAIPNRFPSVSEPPLIVDIVEPEYESDADSIDSEGSSVFSSVSTVVGDPEGQGIPTLSLSDRADGFLPAGPPNTELSQPDVSVAGYEEMHPVGRNTADPINTEEAAGPFSQTDGAQEMRSMEVSARQQLASDPAFPSTLTSEPSVLPFDLGEFFSSPRSHNQHRSPEDVAMLGSGNSGIGNEHLPGSFGQAACRLPFGVDDAESSTPRSRSERQDPDLLPSTDTVSQESSVVPPGLSQSTVECSPADFQPRFLDDFVAPLCGSQQVLGGIVHKINKPPATVIDTGCSSSGLAASSAHIGEGASFLTVPSISFTHTIQDRHGPTDSVTGCTRNSAIGNESETSTGDFSGLGVEHVLGSSSFPRYEHGSPLFAITEDSEFSQEYISLPSHPEEPLEDPPVLVLSPILDCEIPSISTPHDIAGAIHGNPERPHTMENQVDLGFSSLPEAFPLIRRDSTISEIIGEEINDWTLLNVALHDQLSIVRRKPPAGIRQYADCHDDEDPLVTSLPATPSRLSPFGDPNVDPKDIDTAGHQRASSESVLHSEQVMLGSREGTVSYSLTAEQARIFSRVCGSYGLILPDDSARALYERAGWERTDHQETRCLQLAAEHPKKRQRRGSSLAPAPSTPRLPRGYGLSRANFIGIYGPLLFTPDKTYASVSRRGVSPSPTASPASISSVSATGRFEPTKGLNRTRSLINLNRSRGGMDIAANGADLKAQPVLPRIKRRRSLGSLQNPTAHQMLHSILPPGQKPKEVPGAGRGRSPSASPKLAHSTWVREMAQGELSSNAAFGARRRCASQSSMARESSTPSARAIPLGLRGRLPRDQVALPEYPGLSEASSSRKAGQPDVSVGDYKGADKGKQRETFVPAPSKKNRPGLRPPAFDRLLQPPFISSAQTFRTTVESGQKTTRYPEAVAAIMYPRVDDDDAVKRFEEEQGFA